MDGIEFISGSVELLDEIAPLWAELNELHCSVSEHFAEAFAERKFQQRRKELCKKSDTGKLRLDIARFNGESAVVGYCATTLDMDGNGEIDSIYVKHQFRKMRIGGHLMDAGLCWLNSLGVGKISVSVAYGNNNALDFYKKFDFFPRTFQLEQKEADS